jgi:dihydroneopterin aldolase
MADQLNYESILQAALQLSMTDKLRLIERLAVELRKLLETQAEQQLQNRDSE